MNLIIKVNGKDLRPVSIDNNPFKRGQQLKVYDGDEIHWGVIREVEHVVKLSTNTADNTMIVHLITDASIEY